MRCSIKCNPIIGSNDTHENNIQPCAQRSVNNVQGSWISFANVSDEWVRCARGVVVVCCVH